MNINRISTPSFKGNLIFLTRPMTFRDDDCDIGSNWHTKADENAIIEEIRRLMNIQSDKNTDYDLELDVDNITDIEPKTIKYAIPNTDYKASFYFNEDYKPLSEKEYNQFLVAYTAAKTAGKGVNIFI